MSLIEKALARKKASQTVKESAQTITDEVIPETQESTIPQSRESLSETLNIDKESLSQRGYLIDDGERKSIRDEFRQIKRKLLNIVQGTNFYSARKIVRRASTRASRVCAAFTFS